MLCCSMGIRELCDVFGISGDHRRRETHVSIPNTLVKPSAVDGSATTLLCESRLLPGFIFFEKAPSLLWAFVFLHLLFLWACLWCVSSVRAFLLNFFDDVIFDFNKKSNFF